MTSERWAVHADAEELDGGFLRVTQVREGGWTEKLIYQTKDLDRVRVLGDDEVEALREMIDRLDAGYSIDSTSESYRFLRALLASAEAARKGDA